MIDPPRRFAVGTDGWVTMTDCARLTPKIGELITIMEAGGSACWQVARRSWGFALPVALDRPVGERGLRAVLSGKDKHKAHLLLFDPARSDSFLDYETRENHRRLADLSA